jgi:hypothetical protein
MAFFGNSHVDRPLTNISLKYNFAEGIADLVFPTVPVKKESDVYFIYDLSNLRLEETLRANHAKANIVEEDFSTASYNLEEHALRELITDRDRDNADKPLSLNSDATEKLEEKIQIRQEVEIANLAFTTTSWSNTLSISAAAAWSTSGSIPLNQVLTATSLILQDAHIRPNRGILGWETFKALKVNTSTIDMIKYTERGIITEDILASLWDIDKVVVGRASYVNSAEGRTNTSAFIWDDKCLIYYVPQSAKLKTPAAGYNLIIGQKRKVKKWRDEDYAGDWIEVSTLFTPLIVATSAGFLIHDTVN